VKVTDRNTRTGAVTFSSIAMQEAAGAASATTNGTAAVKGSSKAAASDADTQVHFNNNKQVSCGRPYADSHLRHCATISATCSGAATVCCSCNSAVAAMAGSPLDHAQ